MRISDWSSDVCSSDLFLTRCGHITDDKRQEFILLSDVLGLSMLTVAMNNDKPQGCTEATVFGPFHVEGAPHYELGDRSEEHTSELQSLMRNSYAVFCLKQKKK